MTLPFLMRRAMGRNIRLIVMLRDPVDRLHAAFWAGDHYQKKRAQGPALRPHTAHAVTTAAAFSLLRFVLRNSGGRGTDARTLSPRNVLCRYGASEEGFEKFAKESMEEWHRCLRARAPSLNPLPPLLTCEGVGRRARAGPDYAASPSPSTAAASPLLSGVYGARVRVRLRGAQHEERGCLLPLRPADQVAVLGECSFPSHLRPVSPSRRARSLAHALRAPPQRDCALHAGAGEAAETPSSCACSSVVLPQPFVEGWTAAFHRNDILFLRLEDYVKDMPGTLKAVLQCAPALALCSSSSAPGKRSVLSSGQLVCP